MSIWKERDKRFAVNSIFPSFYFAVLAIVLGQMGAARMHASWRVHGVLIAPGLVLLGLSLFRARLHWPAINIGTSSRSARDAGWHLLLFAIGMLSGVLIAIGSVLILGVAATLLYLCPWTKIPACRSRFVVSSLVMLGGTIASVMACGRPVQSLYLMMSAWIMYLPSMCMHLLVLLSLGRGYRIGESHLTDSPVRERVSRDGRIQ